MIILLLLCYLVHVFLVLFSFSHYLFVLQLITNVKLAVNGARTQPTCRWLSNYMRKQDMLHRLSEHVSRGNWNLCNLRPHPLKFCVHTSDFFHATGCHVLNKCLLHYSSPLDELLVAPQVHRHERRHAFDPLHRLPDALFMQFNGFCRSL